MLDEPTVNAPPEPVPPAEPAAIALDATLWDEATTGISQYARCLSGALEQEGVRVARLGASHSGEAPRPRGQGRSAFIVSTLPPLLRERPERLFHAVGNFNLPLQRIPGKRLVLTLHDLIPLRFPETVSRAFRWQFRLWLARSLQVADAVICVSDATQADLAALYPDLRTPVHVVHHGVDHVEHVDDPETERWYRTLGLPPLHVLYAGSLDARKNVGLLLDSMERLRAQGRPLPLVLVGQRWFGSQAIEWRVQRLIRRGVDIRRLDYQPARRLHRLMQGAGVFVFPSRAEGFGLPPLEAMRLGAPTIVSRIPAHLEVCGDAALSVAPDDAQGLTELLLRLSSSSEERLWWSQAGQRRAEQFTWRATARATSDVYRDVLQRNVLED